MNLNHVVLENKKRANNENSQNGGCEIYEEEKNPSLPKSFCGW